MKFLSIPFFFLKMLSIHYLVNKKEKAMKKEIRSISILKTSRILGILCLILISFILFPLGIMAMVTEGFSAGLVFLSLPFIYGFGVYLFCIVSCWIYNLLVPFVGGIEVVLSNDEN